MKPQIARPTFFHLIFPYSSKMFLAFIACAIAAFCGSASPAVFADSPTTVPTTQPISIPESIARGVAFLEQSQNADGSWGTGRETRNRDLFDGARLP